MPTTTEPISALPPKSTFDDADQIPIVDSVTNQTKRISKSTLASSLTSALSGWNNLPYTPSYASNNGNKEFSVTVSADITGILSPGMKMNFTRNVTAPTNCMSFVAASSQYATKASPAGITFTSAYTCEAWVYLNSYASMDVITRRNGSLGSFSLNINSTGQPNIAYGDNAGNFTVIQAYQSLPLKRWMHIAGVVSSVSGKSGSFYINAALVPSSNVVNAATTLTQAGNLTVGAYGAGTGNFFDGLISEARVWSVAQSQANIQANMAISLTGSETNLAALFQGNSNFNDKTANANNLTSSGGAIATQASNPFNNIEYAIISKLAYSAPNTTITLSTGSSCNIPNMVLTSPQYSTTATPYGLPNDLSSTVGRSLLSIPINSQFSTASTSSVSFAPASSLSFTVPMNCNKVRLKIWHGGVSITSGGTGVLIFYNGAVATANQVAQLNITTGNGFIDSDINIPVVPGSTFTLNTNWLTTSGTFTWANAAPGQSTSILEIVEA